VARDRLLSLVDPPAAPRLVLVHAPAGFGKSTLLIQWLQRLVARGECAGWISVDEDDNDSGRFALTLCQALAPDHTQDDADLFDCINLSLGTGRPFTLFLDEVEHLVAAEAIHLLEVLVEQSPQQFRLVLGSRSLPQELLRRARLLADATVVTVEQLAFDRAEVELFLRQRGCAELEPQLYAELSLRTEGWAAAVQLAAAALSEGEAPQAVIDHLTGPRAGLVSYLGDEVLARLPPAQARFLMQTSFLRELAAPLCDAVTGGQGAKEMLQQIEEHNLLLLQLDSGRAWFRYHPLFAECLLQHLNEELPGQLGTLARRACDWCVANGLMEDAADYALLSGDPELYVPRLSACIEGLIGRAQLATAARWLRSVPRAVLVTQPALLTWSAWVSLYENNFVAADVALAELARLAEAGSAILPKERLSENILRVMLLLQRQRFDEATAITDAIVRQAPSEDRHMLARTSNLRALQAQLRGDYVDAARLAGRVMQLCSVSPPIWLSFVHAAHVAGLAELARGNLGEARRQLLSPGRALGGERPGTDVSRHPVASLLAAPCALTLYEQNQLHEAEVLLDRHEPFLNSFFSPSSRTLWYQLRARLHGLSEDQARHEAVIRAGVAYAMHLGLAWMENAIRWEGVAQDLRQGRRDAATQKASPLLGELRLGRGERWIQSCDEVFGALVGAIRYFIHTDATALALQLLEREIAWDEAQGRRLRGAKLHVLQAMALASTGKQEQAQAAMGYAVALGKDCGLIRTFLDEGPLCMDLLRALDEQVPHDTGTPLDAYRRHLLQAFGPAQVVVASGLLSTRELQIIARLAQGHSNLVVSQQLFLSPNTIKWHLSQVYSKLGVRNRTQAVRVAQQRGLLAQN
jgi:LuxR family maltose regulon positive regulatory protein